jgi:hypothetical protein
MSTAAAASSGGVPCGMAWSRERRTSRVLFDAKDPDSRFDPIERFLPPLVRGEYLAGQASNLGLR